MNLYSKEALDPLGNPVILLAFAEYAFEADKVFEKIYETSKESPYPLGWITSHAHLVCQLEGLKQGDWFFA